jgi:RES domain-containing protein
MADRPCGLPDCPIIDPERIDRRRLRVVTWEPGAERYRATRLRHADSVFTPEGMGEGRFSPLAGRPHTYVAEQRSAALLESALHEANGPNPRIYRVQLAQYGLVRVRFAPAVKLVDLRDDALAALGIEPTELTDALPRHYACTRQVAERLVATKDTSGFLWTSRQGRMHAERNRDGLASEVLHHQRLDVAVIYRNELPGRVRIIDTEPLLDGDEPTRFVRELANLLRIAIL